MTRKRAEYRTLTCGTGNWHRDPEKFNMKERVLFCCDKSIIELIGAYERKHNMSRSKAIRELIRLGAKNVE